MSPAVLQSIKKYLQSRHKKPPASQEDIKTLKKITKIYTRLTGWQGKISAAWQKILVMMGHVIYNLFLVLKNFIKKFSKINFLSPSQTLADVKNIFYQGLRRLLNQLLKLKKRFLSLNLKKRLLFSATFIICLILLASLGSGYFNQQKNAEKEKYNRLVKQIENKITEAESNLIYNNENTAEQIIKEIKTLLADFPTGSRAKSSAKERLTSALQPLIYKMQKIQTAASAMELDLQQLKFEQKPSAFVKTSSRFIFFSPNSSVIQSYNIFSKQTTKITNKKIAVWQNIFSQKDGSVLILSGKNSLIQFNPETEIFATQEASWPKDSQIALIATYNAKLYSLDAANNQIYKHLASTTGFGKGGTWLKPGTPVDFSDAGSLDIDGNIYVAKKNGRIYKLESGSLIDLNINFLDPVLTSVTKIYAKNGSDKLFVLDKEKQRVVIWDKNKDKLIAQLTSSEWNDLKDFFVDEKEKKIYLLNGTKILSVRY